jgi:hypothetical protein
LLLVVSTAIVLRSFLLRRRYRLRLQGQFDDVFRLHGGPPESSRRKKFGAKPEVWDTWIEPDDEEKDSAGELADIKVSCLPLPSFIVPIFIVVTPSH